MSAIDPGAWDALAGDDNPFMEHAFLLGLEQTGCVGEGTGWWPVHLVWHDDGGLLRAAMPLYVKGDSFGEFIFDFGWARFYGEHRRRYYPKLVCAVPFSPVTGPRLLGPPEAHADMLAAAQTLARHHELEASGVHALFLTEADAKRLADAPGWLHRLSTQALWLNQDWPDFEAFLGSRRHDTRKQIRRERRAVAEAGLQVRVVHGPELTDADWHLLRRCYEANIDRHRSEAYLNEAFFTWLRERLAHRVVCSIARNARGDDIAATLNLTKGKHLYGRYWGCLEEHPFLHFECAFYALMTHALQHGLTRFEAGAGGEHKLRRGMFPTRIHSLHWLADPQMAAPIAHHVARERALVEQELADFEGHGTARRG
jgi:predicted N-acyltransferase